MASRLGKSVQKLVHETKVKRLVKQKPELSIFDVFKIGIGPSSSHTMGPMVAAVRFVEMVKEQKFPEKQQVRLRCSLHGSLAFTGHGHATDRAVILGFDGFEPATYCNDAAEASLAQNEETHRIHNGDFVFDPIEDLIFDYDVKMPLHANAMKMEAQDAETGEVLLQDDFYSIGGGFVLDGSEMGQQHSATQAVLDEAHIPYPFKTAAEMLEMASTSSLSIAQMKRANENATASSSAEVTQKIQGIWDVMNNCIERGLHTKGVLPGGLNVPRRAAPLFETLGQEILAECAPHTINDWIAVYAMAVNEENAAGGQVVTAPTNGAAGVIPATLRYYLSHVPNASEEKVECFLLTAAAVGAIIKNNASISGAEVGCQGEVGSAAGMAAAGLVAVLGGTPEQIENAAEIALEHHLGMTCDPVSGLVQVPCIERNGLGAIKAVSAASLALRGNGSHLIPLDNCIETMRQTGLDMSDKYKETSLGGLAVNFAAC